MVHEAQAIGYHASIMPLKKLKEDLTGSFFIVIVGIPIHAIDRLVKLDALGRNNARRRNQMMQIKSRRNLLNPIITQLR